MPEYLQIIMCPKIINIPVDAYNASIILKCLHTPIAIEYAQNYADIIYLLLVQASTEMSK